MQKHHTIFIFLIALLLIVTSVSAGIFTIDDVQVAISIKTIGTDGTISKDVVPEKDLKTDMVQSVHLELSKFSKTSEQKTIQLYPESSVVISSDFSGTVNIMQRSKKDGFPLIEVYYKYQKSILESWKYYFRIEKIDNDRAYVIYGDFDKKSVWLGEIPRSSYDEMMSKEAIPAWGTV